MSSQGLVSDREGNFESVLSRVMSLTAEVADGVASDYAIEPDMSFVTSGLDSATLIRLLVRVQDEFHIDWGLDLPPTALDSPRSLATVVADRMAHGREG